MSIANELSSEVAEAVLARRQDESSQSVRELAEVVKEVHSTLRRLTAESRRRKAGPRAAANTSPEEAGGASSG
jgi:16S rRNA C1402 N4-methylase RsmH